MTSTSAVPPKAPPPSPLDVGIVAATAIEVGPLLARFSNVRKYAGPRFTVIEGECGGKLVGLVLTGMGRARAQKGLEILLDGHRPRWVVSAGFGGALDPTLKRNDVFLPGEVVNVEGSRFAIDLVLPAGSERQGLRTGRLLTVDEMVRKATEKAELRQRFEADVVDMETSSLAALCGDRGVKFLAVRVISDEAGVDLPPEVLAIVGPTGGLRLGATIGALWKRPSSVNDLLVLRKHAIEAAVKLGEFLVGAIPRLN
jgi:adenosylhomocysteine nucleosidase